MPTPYLGLNTIPTGSPDYENAGSPVSLLSANMTVLDLKSGVEIETASGAIGIREGKSIITKGSIAAMTLAAPVAGLPSAGGNDGQSLTILSTTAFAHTVTCPANTINGSLHIATFGGTVGNAVTLTAYNGVWYANTTNSVTLS